MTNSTEYDLATIRELLLAAFTPEELRRFCLDRPIFHPVVAEFGPGQGLDDMVDRVIEYCRTRLLWDALLVEVKEIRPQQYDRFEPELGESDPLPPGGPPGRRTIPGPPWRIRWAAILGLALVVVIIAIGLWQWLGPGPSDGSRATETAIALLANVPLPTETPTPASTPETPTPTTTPETPTLTSTPEAPTPTSTPEAPTPPNTSEAPKPTKTPEAPRPTKTPETPVPSCHFVVEGPFSSLWERHQDQLGCPLYPEPKGIYYAEQAFERGRLFWRKDNDHIYAVYEGGSKAGIYESFPPWDGEDYLCPYSPPEDRSLPQLGFGWVWCTQLEDPIITIGWGLAEEAGFWPGNGDPLVQEFERGFILRDSANRTNLMAYVFLDDGTVQREYY